jgi:hypothetical protein
MFRVSLPQLAQIWYTPPNPVRYAVKRTSVNDLSCLATRNINCEDQQMKIFSKLKRTLKRVLHPESEDELKQRFRWISCFLVIIMCIGFVFASYVFDWSKTGFLNKSLWDWMQLLIIPAALAVVAIWFNRVENKNERAITRDNQQAGAFEAYLDKMSDLLLKENLRNSKPDAEVRKIARARTLTVVSQLDGTRKGSVLKFLYEAELIRKDNCIINLVDADFSSAELTNANLRGAYLSGVNFDSANLFHADLSHTNLSNTVLYNATLNTAFLCDTDLSDASLVDANLAHTHFENANLSDANLTSAELIGAKFQDAILTNAAFSSYEIKELITEEQLQQIRLYSMVGDKMYKTTFTPD